MLFSYNLFNWSAITDSVRDCQPGSTFLNLSKIVGWAFDGSIWKIIVQKVRLDRMNLLLLLLADVSEEREPSGNTARKWAVPGW